MTKEKLNRVIVTKPYVGICHMQVCAMNDATDEEILSEANAQNPSGTTNGWGVVIRSGDGKPVPCGDHAETRIHLLVGC